MWGESGTRYLGYSSDGNHDPECRHCGNIPRTLRAFMENRGNRERLMECRQQLSRYLFFSFAGMRRALLPMPPLRREPKE